jgi:hypothetical protein
MKEFVSQTGGRYTYVDDVLNLQDLALSFSSLFDECDNFIVSGCEITGNSIGSGYVYINNKLRYFSGASGLAWPQYIYESNRNEATAYSEGGSKTGRKIYGCAIANKVPTAHDPLTEAVPQFISIASSGGKRLKDALFGKYALILNPEYGAQEVKGNVNFLGNVNTESALTAKDRVAVQYGNAVGQIYYENNAFIIQSQINGGDIYKIALSDTDGFSFYLNNALLLSVKNGGIACKKPLSSSVSTIGNLTLAGNNLYNSGVASEADLNINFAGYNGGSQYFRNTNICNGKGYVILGVDGKNSLVNVNGQLNVSGSSVAGLSLKSDYLKTNNSLRKTISWLDADSVQIGYVGYNSTGNNVFEIRNSIANINIAGAEAVNIGPKIMENGALLSDKYALKSEISDGMGEAVKSFYTKTESDNRFAIKRGGLLQLLAIGATLGDLRTEIGAAPVDTVPLLSKCLSDMATSTALKKKICGNIGAVYTDDAQPKLKDTGWVSIQGALHARQVGNVVNIQGYLTTIHSGTVFTLPTAIQPPYYTVAFSSVKSQWECAFPAGSRECIVNYCNNHGVSIPVSITYIV